MAAPASSHLTLTSKCCSSGADDILAYIVVEVVQMSAWVTLSRLFYMYCTEVVMHGVSELPSDMCRMTKTLEDGMLQETHALAPGRKLPCRVR